MMDAYSVTLHASTLISFIQVQVSNGESWHLMDSCILSLSRSCGILCKRKELKAIGVGWDAERLNSEAVSEIKDF